MAVRLGCPGHVAIQRATHLNLPSRGCPRPSPWVVRPGPQSGEGFEGGQEGLGGGKRAIERLLWLQGPVTTWAIKKTL